MVPSWCVCTRSVRKAPSRKGRHLRLLCVLGELFRCFVLEVRHCLCSASPPREPCVCRAGLVFAASAPSQTLGGFIPASVPLRS